MAPHKLGLFLLVDTSPHAIHPYIILVAAENADEARKFALGQDDWLKDDRLRYEHLGTATTGTEAGIILAGYLDN